MTAKEKLVALGDWKFYLAVIFGALFSRWAVEGKIPGEGIFWSLYDFFKWFGAPPGDLTVPELNAGLLGIIGVAIWFGFVFWHMLYEYSEASMRQVEGKE